MDNPSRIQQPSIIKEEEHEYEDDIKVVGAYKSGKL